MWGKVIDSPSTAKRGQLAGRARGGQSGQSVFRIFTSKFSTGLPCGNSWSGSTLATMPPISGSGPMDGVSRSREGAAQHLLAFQQTLTRQFGAPVTLYFLKGTQINRKIVFTFGLSVAQPDDFSTQRSTPESSSEGCGRTPNHPLSNRNLSKKMALEFAEICRDKSGGTNEFPE